jgi:hypothetical protein
MHVIQMIPIYILKEYDSVPEHIPRAITAVLFLKSGFSTSSGIYSVKGELHG